MGLEGANTTRTREAIERSTAEEVVRPGELQGKANGRSLV
jgi:hypothetical protein